MERWGSPDARPGVKPPSSDTLIRAALTASPKVVRLNGTIVPARPHLIPVGRFAR